MNALILAAGYATRLYPLTRDRPKSLLEVGGATILERLLARLASVVGGDRICLVSNHRFADQFRAFAGERWPALEILDDGSTREEGRLGALRDLAFALREARLDGAPLLVSAGDQLVEFDLEPHAGRFKELGGPLLLVRDAGPRAGPSPYNEVVLDQAGRVISFREKPADPRSNLAAIALYFFPAELSHWLARYLAEGGNPDAPGHLLAWLASSQTPVFASPIESGWFDIGSYAALEAARAALQR